LHLSTCIAPGQCDVLPAGGDSEVLPQQFPLAERIILGLELGLVLGLALGLRSELGL